MQVGAAAGARVTATVRNPALRAAVADLAAGIHVIAPEDAATSGPFDVILELIGAPNMGPNLEVLATGGRISVIGVGAGASPELNLLTLMGKRARIHGSTLRSRPLEEKALAARRVESQLLPHLAAGKLRVPVETTFPMDRANEAYERFAAGGKLGKIVLVVP